MCTYKVLLVDDDPNVLQGYQRSLRRRFDIETALCSEEALTAVNFLGPFAVIVSDMNMPRQNGVQLLQKLIAASPDSVRIMLTGNADQQTATDAINIGKVFRFLSKPCSTDDLSVAMDAAIDQHRLIAAERQMLTETVHGSIRMLTEVLSLVNPVAFGRATRIHELVMSMAEKVKVDHPWECEMAAMLSQVGCVSIPAETLEKAYHGSPLSASESKLMERRYETAYELIRQVPRLENVANIVRLQDENHWNRQPPENIPLAAHFLRIARDYDMLLQNSQDPELALGQLGIHERNYLAQAVQALSRTVEKEIHYELQTVSVTELEKGWKLFSDVLTPGGALLIKGGQVITSTLLARLLNHAESGSVAEPIKVLVPVSLEPALA
jgi:response regulator RpfG family c-di-GMP phosphodiesterase